MMKPIIKRFAEFSADGRCRWTLGRQWDESKGFVLYTGLNPSLAGADTDDMTVTKGIGFACRTFKMGGTLHGNAYPFITPYPSELANCTKQEMEENDRKLLEMAKKASIIVLAWGAFPKHRQRFCEVARLLAPFNPVCLGRTGDGYPKHISRIGYDTIPKLWTPLVSSVSGEA